MLSKAKTLAFLIGLSPGLASSIYRSISYPSCPTVYHISVLRYAVYDRLVMNEVQPWYCLVIVNSCT